MLLANVGKYFIAVQINVGRFDFPKIATTRSRPVHANPCQLPIIQVSSDPLQKWFKLRYCRGQPGDSGHSQPTQPQLLGCQSPLRCLDRSRCVSADIRALNTSGSSASWPMDQPSPWTLQTADTWFCLLHLLLPSEQE